MFTHRRTHTRKTPPATRSATSSAHTPARGTPPHVPPPPHPNASSGPRRPPPPVSYAGTTEQQPPASAASGGVAHLAAAPRRVVVGAAVTSPRVTRTQTAPRVRLDPGAVIHPDASWMPPSASSVPMDMARPAAVLEEDDESTSDDAAADDGVSGAPVHAAGSSELRMYCYCFHCEDNHTHCERIAIVSRAISIVYIPNPLQSHTSCAARASRGACPQPQVMDRRR